MEGLPTGAVTFLFTDVEGSTAAWEERPDAMASDLEGHDRVLRKAIESNGGFVFATGGDSFSAAFGSPSSALTAAVEAQRELVGSDGPLSVRMGVHSGEAVERDGNYFGPALNRTARLMSLGHGGQVLVSTTTAGMVTDERFSLVDLGEHRLKDLTKPVGVTQLVAEGLRQEFPPLHSAVALDNLPFQGVLFGREEDTSELARLLDTSRSVTLVGAGGIGKTTLAVSAARAALDRFADGCWLVDLTDLPAGSSGRVVAGAVGAADSRLGSVDGLVPRELLLVMDNCEHVLAGVVDYLGEVLRAAPGVVVLATSREPLGLDGERIKRVEPLSVGDSPHGDAVDLFVARAADAGVDLDVKAERQTVAAICEAVGGLPLAIELAAARAGVMTPAQILARLDDRLATLKGGVRGPEHHRTIEATIAWSYDLLEQDTQSVFRRLAVFEGGFDLGAAEAVCPGSDVTAQDVVDSLADLVRKSLLHRIEERFVLLESVRQFAAARLDEERAVAEHQHFDFFSGRAHDWYDRDVILNLTTDERVWITANLENLRSAVTWGAEHDNLERAAEVATVLYSHYMETGQPTTTDWFEPLLAHLDQLDPALRMSVLHGSGLLSYLAGDRDQWRRKLAAEYAIHQETGIVARVGQIQQSLAVLLSEEGRHDEAIAMLQEGIRVDAGRGWKAVHTTHNLGYELTYFKGDPKAAMAIIEAVEESPDEFRQPYDSAVLDERAADVLLALGEPDEAWDRAERGLATYREHQVWPDAAALIVEMMSEAAWQRGDLDLAVALLRESLESAVGTRLGNEIFTAASAYYVAELLLALDEPHVAQAVFAAFEASADGERPYPFFASRHDEIKDQMAADVRASEADPPSPVESPKELRALVSTALEQASTR